MPDSRQSSYRSGQPQRQQTLPDRDRTRQRDDDSSGSRSDRNHTQDDYSLAKDPARSREPAQQQRQASQGGNAAPPRSLSMVVAPPVIFKSPPESRMLAPPPLPAPIAISPSVNRILHSPRTAYLENLSRASAIDPSGVKAKSRLLITDLDNTLFAPMTHIPGHLVAARPYLHTFFSYILSPRSPWMLAIWSFSGEAWSIRHLRYVKEGRLFLDNNPTQPLLAPGVAAVWGYEQSGLTGVEMAHKKPPHVKDLNLALQMWGMLNLHRATGDPEWSSLNSLLVDDQASNASTQPDSVILAPVYRDTTAASGIEDNYLLQLIGLLDEIAHEDNFAAAIKIRGWNQAELSYSDQEKYWSRGRQVCKDMGIKVSRGKRSDVDETILRLPVPNQAGESSDPAPELLDKRGRVSSASLRGCCQDPPHPDVVKSTGPTRDAVGMVTTPSSAYENIAVRRSKTLSKPQGPLICLDLDGTLYTRPPCHLDPLGYPAGRPYLHTMLTWLLRPASPWTVAIWTGSKREIAVRCLNDLGLGIVGPELVGPNREAELRHPRLVALFTREDVGLAPDDFNSYVGIVKDFDRLWAHLAETGKGHWSAYDTVMVDDTSAKLRAQPDSYILAPTFNFPLGPGKVTTAALLDTFFLSLIAMLEELAVQSNFANYISTVGWNHGVGPSAAQLVTNGLAILARDLIPVYAQGAGPVTGLPLGKPFVCLNSTANVAAGLDGLSTLHNSTNVVTTQAQVPKLKVSTRAPALFSSALTTSRSPQSPAIAPTSVRSGLSEPHRKLDTTEPFVLEVEERIRLRGGQLRNGLSPRQRLDRAVDDWEDEVRRDRRKAATVPFVENAPYEDGWRSYRRSALDNVSQDDW